jgi:hypothetical protein
VVCETVTTFKVSLRFKPRTDPKIHEDRLEGGVFKASRGVLGWRDCAHEGLSLGPFAHGEMIN